MLMARVWIIIIIMMLTTCSPTAARTRRAVVADSMTHAALPNASVFGRNGSALGICTHDGQLPAISDNDYPVTIRYMGFKEKTITRAAYDTIFLQENIVELPEFTVDTRRRTALHVLAYLREYSTLSSYSDTIFLFREKMVDYMLPAEGKSRFKGWHRPRILSSRSYYRFTDDEGLDSVSDKCGQHFSWTDWVGIGPTAVLPPAIREKETASDTLRGKYSPTEIWVKNGDRVSVDIDVLADTLSRKWVPDLYLFFNDNVDFGQFRIRFNYDTAADGSVSPKDLTGYSYTIESTGRGRGMFMFNRRDEPFFVDTYAEVYVIDKEHISLKEARKWERYNSAENETAIYQPAEAPDLQASVLELIDRVNNVDQDRIRLARAPDQRLAGRRIEKVTAGKLILGRLKGLFGIDNINGKRKMNRQWHKFRKSQSRKNNSKGKSD